MGTRARRRLARTDLAGKPAWRNAWIAACCALILAVATGAVSPRAGATTGGAAPGANEATTAASTTATATCPDELAHAAVASSRPDYALDNQMRSYANSNQGWSGGDGGVSAPLPDGAVAWLFDDSYPNPVVQGTRPVAHMIHNMIVIQHGTTYTALHRFRDGQELEYMNYRVRRGSRHFYWNNGAVASDGALYVSYSSYYYPATPTVFGFVRTGTVIAKYDLPSMRLTAVDVLHATIQWGVWMMHHGPYVYIYGSNSIPGLVPTTRMYLARAPYTDLLGAWQYWDGSAWSSDPQAGVAISSVTGPQFSITMVGNVYVLVTMARGYLSDVVKAYFSCRPMGPFVRGSFLYRTEGGGLPYGTNGIAGVYTYGATVHPQLTNGNQIIVSYDVNTSDWALLNENVNIIRPRYVRANITFGSATA
jgi:hypothetical protein